MNMNDVRILIDFFKIIFNTDKDYIAVRYIAMLILPLTIGTIAITYDAEKRDLKKIKENDEVKDLTIIK